MNLQNRYLLFVLFVSLLIFENSHCKTGGTRSYSGRSSSSRNSSSSSSCNSQQGVLLNLGRSLWSGSSNRSGSGQSRSRGGNRSNNSGNSYGRNNNRSGNRSNNSRNSYGNNNRGETGSNSGYCGGGGEFDLEIFLWVMLGIFVAILLFTCPAWLPKLRDCFCAVCHRVGMCFIGSARCIKKSFVAVGSRINKAYSDFQQRHQRPKKPKTPAKSKTIVETQLPIIETVDKVQVNEVYVNVPGHVTETTCASTGEETESGSSKVLQGIEL